ncbi:MAG: DUF4832 domain-containing protein [Planctomycetes bacterium]|nr:DUF4832 domain-containing protein [Planctomycetota bacterium]
MAKASISRERGGAAKTRRWRSGFGPDEVAQRVRPTEDRGYLANPHRGTTTFQRFNGDKLNPGLTWNDHEGPLVFRAFAGNLTNPRYPDTTLSYCRWLWSVLEPKKGRYRWDIIDGTLKAARERGQTVQMRIQPYIGKDIPQWYWDLGAKAQPTIASPGAGGGGGNREPEHNDPKYLKHFGDIIRAFAKRYDGHPDLESFDIAYGGACGETGGNCTDATARKLVDVYLASFRKTRLLSMLGTAGCRYAARRTTAVGWRADCYGDLRLVKDHPDVPDGLNWNHMYDAYPFEVRDNGVAERWKTAPVTLETCWTVGFWQQHGWDLDWILDQGLKYHTSVFMPKSSFIPTAWRDKIAAFDQRLGYRFVLRQARLPLEAKPGRAVAIDLWIENIGVAPLYHDYALALRFRQGRSSAIVLLESDPRTWLPGDIPISESFSMPKSMRRGEVEVDVGIIDRASQQARVLFAIEDRREDRWHPLTRMDVT